MTPVRLALVLWSWSTATSISAADTPGRANKGTSAATCHPTALIQSKTSSEQTVSVVTEEHLSAADRLKTHGLPVDLPEMEVFVRDKAASLIAGQVAPELVDQMVALMKGFLQDLLQEAAQYHSNDQLAINASFDLLEACEPDLDAQSEDSRKARATHTACRETEGEKNNTQLTACNEYQSKRKGEFANPPSCDLHNVRSDNPQELEEFETCMKLLVEWMKVHEYALACRQAEESHKKQTEQCAADQEEFQEAVCTQAAGQHMFCSCHDGHLTFYEKLEKDVRARQGNRKVDHQTAKRIECYLDVLETHNASSELLSDRTSSLQECIGMSVSDEPFSISYGKPESLGNKCMTIDKPCEESWVSTEYWKPWNATAPPAACTPCKTTTTTTTTITTPLFIPDPKWSSVDSYSFPPDPYEKGDLRGQGGEPQVEGTAPRTVSFWLKPEEGQSGDLALYCSGSGGLNWGAFTLSFQPASSRISLYVGGGDFNGPEDQGFIGGWSHFAASFDGDKVVKFYYNGTMRKLFDMPSWGNFRTSAGVQIGACHGKSPYKGKIDTVRVHAAELSPSQVFELHERSTHAFLGSR